MKIGMPHAQYIASKVAIDLFNSGYVTFFKGLEPVKAVAQLLIEEDMRKEEILEARVDELINENEDEMRSMGIERRDMFWPIKRKMAKEYGVILSYEERYSHLSHQIMDRLWEESLMDYSVSENIIKNIIFNAIEGYAKVIDDLEDVVLEKMSKLKKRLVPGSDAYNITFERLYREELQRKGMF